MIDISVVVPVFNKEPYLKSLFETIYAQTYKPTEVIIIDDSSTDSSLTVIEKYQKKYGFDLLKNKKNMGVSATRNRGILKAKSNYVALLDCDDTWNKDFLKLMANKIEQQKYHLLGSGYNFQSKKKIVRAELIIPNGKTAVVKDYFEAAVSGDLPFTCSSVIIEKSAFLDCGGFSENLSMGEDQLLWNKFITKGYNCAVFNIPLANYLIDAGNSACNDYNKSIIGDFLLEMDNEIKGNKYKKKYIDKHVVYAFTNAIKSSDRSSAISVLNHPLTSKTLKFLFKMVLLMPLCFTSKIICILYDFLDRKRS